MLIDLLASTMSCRSTQVKIASTDLWPQGMFTFSEMLALVESESSIGAYVCYRRPGGSTATSDLVLLLFWLAAARLKHFSLFAALLLLLCSKTRLRHPKKKAQEEKNSPHPTTFGALHNIHLFVGRAVKRERRKGSFRRQQTAYGAAVNKVAREVMRSTRWPKREVAAEGTSSTTGRLLLQSVLVSAVNSRHCRRATLHSVAAVTPGHPNQSLCPECVGVQRREDTFYTFYFFFYYLKTAWLDSISPPGYSSSFSILFYFFHTLGLTHRHGAPQTRWGLGRKKYLSKLSSLHSQLARPTIGKTLHKQSGKTKS